MTAHLRAQRFELPEGLEWRDIELDDESWLNQMKPEWRERCIGKIAVTVRLRRETDGVERTYSDGGNAGRAIMTDEIERRGVDGILGGIRFHWTEGNFGCNCNRSLFFHEAGGEPRDAENPYDEKGCDELGPYTCVWPPFLADDHEMCGKCHRVPVLEGEMCDACFEKLIV